MCCRQRRQSPQGQSFSRSLSIIMVPWFSCLFTRLAGSRKYPPCAGVASSISTFQLGPFATRGTGPCTVCNPETSSSRQQALMPPPLRYLVMGQYVCRIFLRWPISTARHLRLRNPSYTIDLTHQSHCSARTCCLLVCSP